MSEKRKKSAQVCVKNGANGHGTVEVFPAQEWNGPLGHYRLRYRRTFVDGTHGAMRFFTPPDIGVFIASLLFDATFCAESSANEAPQNMHCNALVSVPTGRYSYNRAAVRLSTEAPFRGADGRWYVGAYLIGRGVVMIPCDDVIIKEVRARFC